jgi:hypothetical protein
MNILKVMFNSDWHIDGTDLIFENVEYFRNGNQYTGGLNIIDIRTLLTNQLKNKYEYDKESLCHFENITFQNNDSMDFLGIDIIYDAHFNSEKQISKTHTADITTDLANVYINSASMPNDGFCMAVIEYYNDLTNPTIVKVINYAGAITGQTLSNGLLSISVLEDKFYKYYRPILHGFMNLIEQDFLSVQPNKKQVDTYKFNCANDFEPLDRFETELGVGELDEYQEDLTTNEVALKLRY